MDELLKKLSLSCEEEFVIALEHYISLKNNVTTKDEAYKSFLSLYGDSCFPVAVIIFDELVRFSKLPEDFNEWICDLLSNGGIKVGRVESQVNGILPGYIERIKV